MYYLFTKVSSGSVVPGGRRNLNTQNRCVPYVSQYTNCNEFNQCEGCTKCLCAPGGIWECRSVKICNEHDEQAVDDEMFEAAIDKLDIDMKKFKKRQQKYEPSIKDLISEGVKNKSKQTLLKLAKINKKERQMEEDEAERFTPAPVKKRLVPAPPGANGKDTGDLLDEQQKYDPIKSLNKLLNREKRSANKKNTGKHSKRSAEKTGNKRQTRNSIKSNETIKFYSTVDELNEDTLQHSNISGTLPAKKMDLHTLPDLSRRSNVLENSNNSLHIDFNHPNHITDNKIDSPDAEKFDLSHEKLNMILSNHSQKTKDKELSKLVVNELKPGSEIVGDIHAPVTSNITFTLENDTLTAMAYIAGNLLNKLWTMEKDSTGSALETEDMKHEKISDLLDLFKEPLNLKQEKFLKNVLERLSTAIDTDKEVKNVTICQTIEEATKLIHKYDSPNEKPVFRTDVEKPCNKPKKEEDTKINQYATAKAISKINTVLRLLKTFENINANISNIKNGSKAKNFTEAIDRRVIVDTILTKPEANSLNIYGNILDKIVKVLLPNNGSKKIAKVIKQKNMLSNDETVRDNYMKMFNTDLSNLNVTAKDKIILDYLTHINNKPDCILNKNKHSSDMKSLPTLEGNILLNLSEFFKIKSITDLVNLVEPPKPTTKADVLTSTTTTMKPTESSKDVRDTTIRNNLRTDSEKFASTKEKLKAHLKTIIEDLIELQDAKGIHSRGNIRIADALPCIYNIMNAGNNMLIKSKEEQKTADNIADMFKELRIDMRRMQTRRSDSIMKTRPKSAVVLERIIKTLGEKSKSKTRRMSNVNEKSFDRVKNIIRRLNNVSSTYKNQALYYDVPAAEKLVLLKALQEEVKKYITVLEEVRSEDLSKLSEKQLLEVNNFILSSASNITLDVKVMTKLEQPSPRKPFIDESNTSDRKQKPAEQKSVELNANDYNKDMMISRQEIINHLIKKRVETYLKLKEAKELNVHSNMNYNIGKKILFYLNNGNENLARELYKMLIAQGDMTGVDNNIGGSRNIAVPSPKPVQNPQYQFLSAAQSPAYSEPKILDTASKFMTQDHLIKQLLNMKNMGIQM